MPGPLSKLFTDDDHSPDQSNATVVFVEGEPSDNPPDDGGASFARASDPGDPGRPTGDYLEPQGGGDSTDAF